MSTVVNKRKVLSIEEKLKCYNK